MNVDRMAASAAMVSIRVFGLLILLSACAAPKETGVTMERTVSGDYLKIAKCVHGIMARETPTWVSQLVEWENEKAAEVFADQTTTFITSATARYRQQRFEQHRDQVKMILYVPSIGGSYERRYVNEYWDKCAPLRE